MEEKVMVTIELYSFELSELREINAFFNSITEKKKKRKKFMNSFDCLIYYRYY